MFEPFSRTGVGMHTGEQSRVRVEPTDAGRGLVFETSAGPIPARSDTIDRESARSTDLVCRGARIRTVEHLLAALAWCGERDATIAVDGPEIPILDGSAGPWIASLLAAGATPGPRFIGLGEPVEVEIGGSRARLDPCGPDREPVYRVELRYDDARIGPSESELRPASQDFVSAIAPARTFALEREVAEIREAGLGRGGSLGNALIIGEHGPLNPCGMRFADEPARHKLLDAIGDLSLLGGLPWAAFTAVAPGHALNHAIVRRAADLVTEAPR
jgi:UDP-3-O-[3-hydroxymyristoyl] N-acetylglucosamine deacetylase